MMRYVLLLTPLIILGALVALFAANIDRDASYIPSVMINKPAPELDLAAVEGLGVPGISPADLKGDVHVVNVFASWCVPCREEHPILMQLAADGIPLYGINHKDQPENARAFLAGLGNPYERVGSDLNGRAGIEWGVYGVPETFVVNAQGIITYKHVGPLNPTSVARDLLPAIEAAQKG